jgi:hypothetical protein
MKARLGVLLVACTLLVAVGLPAAAGAYSGHPTVKLGTARAKAFMSSALHADFESWAVGLGKRVKCTQRVSRDRVHCQRIVWGIGDSVFFGSGTIWLTYEGSKTFWNDSYRITEYNEYCNVVEHLPVRRCEHHFNVH